MKKVFNYVLSNQPWVIRWMFYIVMTFGSSYVFVFKLGVKFLPTVNAHIVEVVEDWSEPKRLKRDGEIQVLNVKLDSIARYQNDQGQDIREIRHILMNQK